MPTASSAWVVREESSESLYQAGDVICNRYRLETPVGFGGMGTVWRAYNEHLDAPLALKLIHRSARWPGSSERLLIEAKAAASLRHPSVIRVFDFGLTEQGDPFLAMELLRGESLRDLLDREHALTAFEAIRTLLPILAGLGCAHGRGIIHRDLKPDNIVLARDDTEGIEPKLVDFGIAKFAHSVSRLTTAGVLLGSPSYMSPEQSMGEDEIDLRADIWAFAVVLYEAIAGHPPWEASNCPALLRAIVDDPAPSLIGIGGVDPKLWTIIVRGLAKRREDRWGSTGELGRALATWLWHHSITDDISGTSLKTTWLSDESCAKRGSLGSIPALSANATIDGDEQPCMGRETQLAQETLSSRLPRPSMKRTLGLGVPIAISLALFGVGFRSSRAPSAASSMDRQTVVQTMAPQVPATVTPPILTDEITVSALPPPPGRTQPIDAPRSPRTGRNGTAPSKRHPSNAPPKGSARAMNFGF
jgi:serine/threonine-protein kinase